MASWSVTVKRSVIGYCKDLVRSERYIRVLSASRLSRLYMEAPYMGSLMTERRDSGIELSMI